MSRYGKPARGKDTTHINTPRIAARKEVDYMNQRGFSRFCTDSGVIQPLPGYHDEGCVVPAGGASQAARPRRSTATRDAAAKLRRDVETIKLTAKMDKLIELMTKRVKAQDAAPQLPRPVTDPRPTAGQMAAQYRREYERRSARICADAKAAYDARNPHLKKQGV